jgi:hypothetical protein
MRTNSERVASRRQAIALGVTAFAGLGMGYLVRTPEAGHTSLQYEFLKRKPVTFGGGLSLLGPFSGVNGGQVWLRSIFAYGPNLVLCTVEDNPEGFIFPTATMGNVPLDPHSFFMYMGGSKVDKAEYSELEDHMTVQLSGALNCHTEALTASGKFGGRNYSEPANFEATAMDGEDFFITVAFDKDSAPVNSAIFGPKFTFKGKLTDGSVVVTTADNLGKEATHSGGEG